MQLEMEEIQMDIEVFRTSDEEERKQFRKILMDRQLSFSERWERIPMIKRPKHGGKKEMCVIYISDYYSNRVEELRSLVK